MSSDRDRLIELVDKAKEEYANDITDHTETDYIVECLFNNGVIVPPCKLNQIMWKVFKENIDKCKVSGITQKADGSFKIRLTHSRYRSVFEITPDRIGEDIFLTKEEAESELRKRSDNNA